MNFHRIIFLVHRNKNSLATNKYVVRLAQKCAGSYGNQRVNTVVNYSTTVFIVGNDQRIYRTTNNSPFVSSGSTNLPLSGLSIVRTHYIDKHQ